MGGCTQQYCRILFPVSGLLGVSQGRELFTGLLLCSCLSSIQKQWAFPPRGMSANPSLQMSIEVTWAAREPDKATVCREPQWCRGIKIKGSFHLFSLMQMGHIPEAQDSVL